MHLSNNAGGGKAEIMSEIDRKEKERVRLTEKGRDTEIGIEREREGGGEIDKERDGERSGR